MIDARSAEPASGTPAPAPPMPTFREIFDRELVSVYNALRRLGIRTPDLPDATQEVFATVAAVLDDYDPARPYGLLTLAPCAPGVLRCGAQARVEEPMNDDVETLLVHDVDERVPEDHERRIRDGLGALLATPSAAPQTDAPSPSPSIPGVLGKWLTVGVVVGAAVGGFAAGRATAPATTTAPVATATPAATTAAASSTAIAATPSTASPPLEPVPPTLAPAVATGSSTSGHATAAPPPTTSTDAFDREQSMLERARSALVRHDAAAAEQALDECERQFHAAPRHAEERDYLRIQALRERGDNARTRERARAFLTKYPTSLYRGRIEPLVE